MFSEVVRVEIESQTKPMLARHPAMLRARAGRIGPAAVQRYLKSVHYLLCHTGPHLVRARAVAMKRRLPALAAYFQRKWGEEDGHHHWAEDDLRTVGDRFELSEPADVLPAVRDLVEFLADLIERDPRLYLVYVLSNEYFTVLAGPEWVEALTAQGGLPRNGLSAVTKHVEADRHHVIAGFDAIDVHVQGSGLEGKALETVRHAVQLFSRLFDQVAEAAQA